ncbi:HpcH/HpaI aldolase family protein [Actomonas aquatica]|uniref:Aldolase/citrate lyase family protein n=1 Tax=Actomonas aquatica TaxID=2866162 RepID=A0ABZ1CEI7_9BACT|nr:aldolase/citrate lyase family protein [Opitutus sp. WL0086]WRQ90102.1 aldolase/citrate lyase family protein [Opitutus sp. WL0086]
MRPSLARARLLQQRPVRIVCMYYPTAMLPAHAAKAGYDAVWLDTEHNTWDPGELRRVIQLHHLANIDCIVRTGSRDPATLYHLLEDGATGLMVPFVNTAADAAALVRATRFPPLGERGLDGASLDNHFYLNGTTDYPAQANAQTLLIAQIETPEAVANVDAIAATPGIDGLFIGPGDLSLRLGCPLDWNEPAMIAAEDAVAAAAKQHGIAWGRPAGSAEQITAIAAKGAQLIAHGSDFGSVLVGLQQGGATLQSALPAS